MSPIPSMDENILSSRILIVEDDNLGRTILERIFERQGFTNIAIAVNGKEALEVLLTTPPDLIILDVLMPEMDGIECCKRIRNEKNPRISQTPILVQTALDSVGDKARLFAAGATDYITKPVDADEITARARVHLERGLMMRRLRDYNERVQQELDIARTTQMFLLPAAAQIEQTQSEYAISIASHYQPSHELGGDLWGFNKLSPEELAVYSVDFSGHGAYAALNVVRLHALMQTTMAIAKKPGEYLGYLNSMLLPLLPRGQFATMFYGIINIHKHTLSYSSAACPALVFKQYGHSYQLLQNSGGLLGASAESCFHTAEIAFDKEDCLLLCSDALTETEDSNGKMFSMEAVAALFASSLRQHNSATHATQELFAHFRTHYEANLSDDLTLAAFCQC